MILRKVVQVDGESIEVQINDYGRPEDGLEYRTGLGDRITYNEQELSRLLKAIEEAKKDEDLTRRIFYGNM